MTDTTLFPVVKFDFNKAALAEFVARPLDESNLADVKTRAKELQKTRTSITKIGKTARDDANAWNKMVLEQEKELVAVITPEEDRLNRILDEAERQAEMEKRKAVLPIRKEMLASLGIELDDELVLSLDEDQFAIRFAAEKGAKEQREFLAAQEAEAERTRAEREAQIAAEAEERGKRMAEEEAARKAEQEAAAKAKAEKEAEEARKRQEENAHFQAFLVEIGFDKEIDEIRTQADGSVKIYRCIANYKSKQLSA